VTERITVLVVDDHPVVRKGIISLLSNRGDVEVVGQAGNAAEAVAVYTMLRPDVVLLDIRLGEESGLDVLDELLEIDPGARVLVLSSFDDEEYVTRSLRAGALGYLLKADSDGTLLSAIDAVAAGRHALSPMVTDRIVARVFGDPTEREPEALDRTQRRLLEMVAAGATNAEIAEALFMSNRTVKRRLSEIFSLLGVDNRTEAAAEAARRGLI